MLLHTRVNPSASAVPTERGASVLIQSVSRHYGGVRAVDDVSLDVRPGEFVSLLGSSGSGKTTLLMMLAGFESPTSGQIMIGGRDCTNVPPNKRNLGMVFQKYALFPHMTVAENIAFPLRMRGVPPAARQERIQRALEIMRLQGYETRVPAQLSGGQQQRVALARAIVFDPPVILMDEPLGALDKKLREHLQLEIKQLQKRLGATVIYVTHDQEEALTMSDRVAVMSHGKFAQIGPPRELYDHPANEFVADFMGEMNFLSGEAVRFSDGVCEVRLGPSVMHARLPSAMDPILPGRRARVAVRPDRLLIRRQIASDTVNDLRGQISQVVFSGASLGIVIDLAQLGPVRANVNSRSDLADLRAGDDVSVTWAASDAHVFPESS